MSEIRFTVPGVARGRGHKLASDEQVLAAYGRTRSIHKAAAEIGLCPQSVHERLKRLGVKMRGIAPEERAVVEAYYRDTVAADFNLGVFAASLGRSKSTVSAIAGELGLTSRTRAVGAAGRERMVAASRARMATQPHPRGMAGKKHTPETLAAFSAAALKSWARMKATGTGNMSPANLQALSDRTSARHALDPATANPYSRTKSGVRPDLGIFVRSAWEANYARYLNWLQARGDIERWEYEPETFWFEAIRRGVRSYRPDFKIWEKGRVYFVEVKGWMDDKSKTKLRRMKKYHPSVEVRLFGEADYRDLKSKLSRIIPGWEGSR